MAVLPLGPPPSLYSIKNPPIYGFYPKRTLPFVLISSKPFPPINIILNIPLYLPG
jgi:hypothetical protein